MFEHLEDPKRILTILNSLLKPGGKILINTGTQEYIKKYDPEAAYIDPSNRGHISIYSLKTFGVLAGFLGLKSILPGRSQVRYVAGTALKQHVSPSRQSSNPEAHG